MDGDLNVIGNFKILILHAFGKNDIPTVVVIIITIILRSVIWCTYFSWELSIFSRIKPVIIPKAFILEILNILRVSVNQRKISVIQTVTIES